MKQITVVMDDRVGLLADLSYLLGKAKINIDSISAEVQGGKAVINLVVSDEKKAVDVLKANGYHVLSSQMIVIKVKDAPGELSEVSKKLQKAKVNIENLFLLARGNGYSFDAIKVDKPKAAKKALSQYLIQA
jgi:hypothetical protein